jgi:hypothetical protein
MFRKTMTSLISIMLVLVFIGSAAALEEGNKRKGKYTYRKVYKACFERGQVASEVPHLSPSAKTQAQWAQIFQSKDFDQFKCQEEWAQLSQEDINDIYAYLYNFAADSPTPATCK